MLQLRLNILTADKLVQRRRLFPRRHPAPAKRLPKRFKLLPDPAADFINLCQRFFFVSPGQITKKPAPFFMSRCAGRQNIIFQNIRVIPGNPRKSVSYIPKYAFGGKIRCHNLDRRPHKFNKRMVCDRHFLVDKQRNAVCGKHLFRHVCIARKIPADDRDFIVTVAPSAYQPFDFPCRMMQLFSRIFITRYKNPFLTV